MYYQTVDLYQEFPCGKRGDGGGLTVYAPDPNPELSEKRRPAALVLAGGGYRFLSCREGEPIVLRLLAEGFAVFRLSYSLNTPFPMPLTEAAMAVTYIRKNAARYGADGGKVCVFGFSAGGHLAAMLSTLFACGEVTSVLQGDAPLARPDAAVLGYPVITTDPALTHSNTAKVISDGDGALRKRLSLEHTVTAESVPAFIWHTVEDDCVPVENSLLFAAAYRRAGVPFELHLFERGVHGLSLADGETSEGKNTPLYNENAQAWFALALQWLKLRGFSVR